MIYRHQLKGVKVIICSWCGKKITGKTVAQGETGPLVNLGQYHSGDDRVIIAPKAIAFCSHGCAWAYWAERHQLWGMSGPALRSHLADEHGLVHPPGPPAGGMSPACSKDFAGVSRALRELSGGENG